MKFREVFRYEVEYRLGSPSTWIYFGILFALAFALVRGAAHPVRPITANAPAELATIAIGLGAFAIMISAALFGDAAVRDPATGMAALLYTTPLRKIEYLGGRYLAALAINVLVLLAIPLGMAAPMLLPHEAASFGPFQAGAYVQPYVLLLLPSLVFSGAVLFAIGAMARNAAPVYLGALGLIITYGIAGNYFTSVENPVLVVLADPLGINALSGMTAYWTVVERNARLIGFPTGMLWNRVAWLPLAALIFALLHRAFRFAHADGGVSRSGEHAAVEKEQRVAAAVPRVNPVFGSGTTVRQILAIAGNALTELVATPSFVLVLAATVALTMLWGWNVGSSLFDTTTWPVTMLVAETALSLRVLPVIYVLIALYAGELVWKERESGVAEVADAAPVPDGVALAGRFLALVAMLALIQAAILCGGIAIQAFHGYYHFEIGLYIRIMFGLNLTNFVLLAALAMTIHVAVNSKYVGHLVVILTLIGLQAADRAGIIRHYLLLYGRDPGWTYSDMNGFGPFIEAWLWFKLYWAAWAVLLGVFASALWVRGRESGLRRRLRRARARFAGSLVRTAAVAGVLVALLGGFIFYNTNILNEYTSPDEQGATRAAYEQRYARYENLAQPTIESAVLRVEIYPDRKAVDMRGTYRVTNRTVLPIDAVHVYIDPDIDTRSISFDHPATQVVDDVETGYNIYKLGKALQPGESMDMSFDVGYQQRGFPNSDIPTSVARNGAYFDRRWMPVIGYQPLLELSDPEARTRFGLPPQQPLPHPAERGGRRYREALRDADLVHVDMVIGTSAGQIANTPGVLQKEWTENGRSYFHFATEIPAAFGGTVFSGQYAVADDRWNDVAIKIFHHPEHDRNLDTFRKSAKAALDYYSTAFGPYQYSQLRIVEIPRYDSFGRAHPYITAFTEDNFITRRIENEFDQTFFGTAHEVAHSWWGGQVTSALDVSGGQGFTESLANYSAMVVTEKTFGPEAAKKVYDYQMNRYLSRRATQGRDVPWLEAYDQPWIFYGKGAVALWSLRELVGENSVNAALQTFLAKNRAGVPPYPTSYDLLAELRVVTPDSLHYILTDLFETVTLWDASTRSADVARNSVGDYVVTLNVVASKVRGDRVGNETEVPMNDFIEIGVFAEDDGNERGEHLYLQRHRIVSGVQTIRVTVRSEPARAGIDPHNRLIDRDRANNILAVSATDVPARPVRDR